MKPEENDDMENRENLIGRYFAAEQVAAERMRIGRANKDPAKVTPSLLDVFVLISVDCQFDPIRSVIAILPLCYSSRTRRFEKILHTYNKERKQEQLHARKQIRSLLKYRLI